MVELPSSPSVAVFLAGLWRTLNCDLQISAEGRRVTVWPEHFPDGPPQMPDAEPWERFLTIEQYHGARRMVGYLIRRLAPEDRELIFDAFAHVSPGVGGFDFRSS